MAPRPPVRLSRRALLSGIGAGALLVACGGDPRSGQPSAPLTGSSPGAGLNVQVMWPELIVGPDRRLQFVALGPDNTPILDADLTVTLRAAEGGGTIGPIDAVFHGDPRIPSQGLYQVTATVEDTGVYDVEATAADGRTGSGVVQAMEPDESRAPAHGEVLPAVDTPTVEDPQDLEQLCTRDPDCSMHDTSLAAVIGTGVPIVLTIATPAFCSSAICGPVVDDVEAVKQSLDRSDLVFIHAEPFKDAGNTPTPIVDELELPTEPWTYVLDGDGAIVERFPGPVLPDVLRAVVERV